MSNPIYVFKTLIPGSSNLIGTVSTAVPSVVTLNTSGSTLDTGRRIVFTSTAADTSSLYITFNGTREGGGKIKEAVRGSTSGAGANASTLSDFLTITSFTISSNANVPILVGTSSVGGTVWQQINQNIAPLEVVCGITMSSGAVAATATATIEHTYDSITGIIPNQWQGANGSTLAANIGVPSVYNSTSLLNIGSSNLPFWSPFPSDTFGPFSPLTGWRLTITSTSSAATVFASVVQSGIG